MSLTKMFPYKTHEAELIWKIINFDRRMIRLIMTLIKVLKYLAVLIKIKNKFNDLFSIKTSIKKFKSTHDF